MTEYYHQMKKDYPNEWGDREEIQCIRTAMHLSVEEDLFKTMCADKEADYVDYIRTSSSPMTWKWQFKFRERAAAAKDETVKKHLDSWVPKFARIFSYKPDEEFQHKIPIQEVVQMPHYSKAKSVTEKPAEEAKAAEPAKKVK